MTTKSSAKSSPRPRSTSSTVSRSHAKASAKPAAKPATKSRASHAAKTTRASTRSSHAAKTSGHASRSVSHAKKAASPAHSHLVLQPQPPMESSIPTALTDPQSFERQPEPPASLRATGVTEAEARTPHEALSDSFVQSLPQRLDEFRAMPGQVRDLVVERVGEVRSQITRKLDAIRAWPKHAVQSVMERAGEITGLRRLLSPSEAEPSAAE